MTTWNDLLHPGDATNFFDREPRPRFDPETTEYRWENAWWLAELCRLIYRHDVEEDANPPSPTRADFLAKAGLRQVCFFNASVTSTQAFLVQSTPPPLYSALIFRGTEMDIRDFLRDLDFASVPFADGTGSVHRGFFEAYRATWPDVAAALDGTQGPVFYAGHSLGAAIATVFAARRSPTALYTFGSPLVGDAEFASNLAGTRVFRVVDGVDAVTFVPPEQFGFRHVGDVHRLRSPAAWWANPFEWFRRSGRPPKPLDDHAPVNYVARLGP